MSRNPLTPEIIVETLKRSSLKTVLVEGSDDINVYNKIESKIGVRNVDFMPCGGRNTLLKVYERKDEIEDTRMMFLADSDSWIYSNVPDDYKEVFFTKGYSIENDLFEDGNELLLNILNVEEREKFKEIIDNITEWYAFEIEKVIANPEQDSPFCDITLLSTSVMEKHQTNLCPNFLQNRDYSNPNPELVQSVKDDYILKLRGKFIFQIFEKLFQERTGDNTIKYHKKQLFDLCFIEGTKSEDIESNMNKMIDEIKKFLE